MKHMYKCIQRIIYPMKLNSHAQPRQEISAVPHTFLTQFTRCRDKTAASDGSQWWQPGMPGSWTGCPLHCDEYRGKCIPNPGSKHPYWAYIHMDFINPNKSKYHVHLNRTKWPYISYYHHWEIAVHICLFGMWEYSSMSSVSSDRIADPKNVKIIICSYTNCVCPNP